MAPEPPVIDHQVTYVASPELHAHIRSQLAYHRIVNRVLRTSYLDSAAHDLHRRGITLRERCSIAKNGKLGVLKVEAKIPSSDGLLRVSGSQARQAVVNIIGSVELQTVAAQTKTRQLLLVSGRFFAPDFVVALDVADVEANGNRTQRHEVETQIFTSLPWTMRVSPDRVERFHQFCQQLEHDFTLARATQSGYRAITMNARPDRPEPPEPVTQTELKVI